MTILNDIERGRLEASVVTTGNFDGVHRGHRFLLEELVVKARALCLPSVVVMFSPHPRQILSKGQVDFLYLSAEKEQEALLADCGIDYLVKVPFTIDMASWSADDFISKILIDGLGMKFYLIGYDHRLGNPQYDNNIELLAEKYGFGLKQGVAFVKDGIVCSSTAVRQALAKGEVDVASSLLGRAYGFSCTVVSGKRIGRTIGYPTANLQPCFEKITIPVDGVYAVRVEYEGQIYGGMMQVGHRPTLDDNRGLTLEVHIFDFNQDIYHKELFLTFVKYMRSIERFDGLNALIEQLQKDEIRARELLS